MKLLKKECKIEHDSTDGYFLTDMNGYPYMTDEVDLHQLAEESGLAGHNFREGIFPWFPSKENLIKFIDFVNNGALEYWKSWYKKMTGKDI